MKGVAEMCKVNTPNEDQMWNLAGQDRSISREEIGVDAPKSSDGLQALNEGFNFLQFNDQSGNIYKGTEDD